MPTTPKLLILGGGAFVGSALIGAARARGWDITCLSRGIRPLPSDVTAIVADRLDEQAMTAALAGADYDYVVDTWRDAPRAVALSARLLTASGCRYGYVSTRSVYDGYPDGADESAATVDADPDADSRGYGTDKRGAELALERELELDRVVFLRAGAILGPEENYGRGPWWLGRMARATDATDPLGAEVLAPGPKSAPLQFVDVRDLAEFALDTLVEGFAGPVDVVNPSGSVTMGSFLVAAREAVAAARHVAAGAGGADAHLTWVDDDWLLEQGVGLWNELPLWAPPGSEVAGLHSSDTSRAVAAGLRSRPVLETLRDTWASILAGETPAEPIASGLGLDPQRESELLRLWAERA